MSDDKLQTLGIALGCAIIIGLLLFAALVCGGANS